MENEVPVENYADPTHTPLLGNLKRSSAMAALSPKDRQRMQAKVFKIPAPVPLLLEKGSPPTLSVKSKIVPSPVKVPPNTSPLSSSERYSSPTDSLVSPITKGILARNRRNMRLLNPWGPSKVSGNILQGKIRTMKPMFTTTVEQ